MRAAALAMIQLATGTAAAEPPKRAAGAEQKAFELFDRSQALYKEGNFAAAAQLLRDAYALFPDPTLLYNEGRALESAGELRAAAAAYRRYLDEARQLQDRGAIVQRIATLEKQAGTLEEAARRAAEPAPALAAAPPPSHPWNPVPWLIGGAGVLALGVGTMLHESAVGLDAEARADTIQASAFETRQRAEGRNDMARGFFIAGGVLSAALFWGLFDLLTD